MISATALTREFSVTVRDPGLTGALRSMVNRRSRTITAVKDVTFSLEGGTILGLLGPNGSGKTTTLKCIAGLLTPTSGSVEVLLGTVYVQDVPKIVLAFGLGGYAVATGGGPATVLGAAAGLVAVACACVLMWAGGVLANVKSITHVQADGMFALHAAHNLARVPTSLYGPVFHVLLTVVLPIAFLTTIPAELFFGLRSLWWLAASIALTAAVVWVTSRLWHRELRNYSGAMG